MTKVFIADDHPIILSGVRALLAASVFDIVGEARDADALLHSPDAARADILLVDLNMPGYSGLELLRLLRTRGDKRKFVILTSYIDDGQLADAIAMEVEGLVQKDSAEDMLIRCLNEVSAGRRWIDRELMLRAIGLSGANDSEFDLSERERAVADLVATGMSNDAIAQRLCIGQGTVKTHLRSIFGKMGVINRTELALKIAQNR